MTLKELEQDYCYDDFKRLVGFHEYRLELKKAVDKDENAKIKRGKP